MLVYSVWLGKIGILGVIGLCWYTRCDWVRLVYSVWLGNVGILGVIGEGWYTRCDNGYLREVLVVPAGRRFQMVLWYPKTEDRVYIDSVYLYTVVAVFFFVFYIVFFALFWFRVQTFFLKFV